MKDKNSIVLIGGGGHCKSVIDTINECGLYNEIFITDPLLQVGEYINGAKVYGSDGSLQELFNMGIDNAFISIGSIKVTTNRRKAYKFAASIGYNFPYALDKTSVISRYARIGRGVYVGKMAAVNTDSVISDFAIINTGAIIEHECLIGEFTHVAGGATICGGCKIENDVFIGANATVIQGVKIGMNSIIGAGSIVLADVPENTKVVGVWGGAYRIISRTKKHALDHIDDRRCAA